MLRMGDIGQPQEEIELFPLQHPIQLPQQAPAEQPEIEVPEEQPA